MEAVEDILLRLKDEQSISAQDRVVITDVYNLYHTPAKTTILYVLLPIIKRLRTRVKTGDVNFFASPQFIASVSVAVEERCALAATEGKIAPQMADRVGPTITPILTAIQLAAKRYLHEDKELFEFIHDRLEAIIDKLDESKPL